MISEFNLLLDRHGVSTISVDVVFYPLVGNGVTANHLLSTPKRMLNLAVKWKLLEKNTAVSQGKFKGAASVGTLPEQGRTHPVSVSAS